MLSLLRLSFLPANASFGLLILRLWFGGSMLWLHGLGKLKMLTGDGKAPDGSEFPPMIVNPTVTLGLVTFAEFVCAILIVIGLFTRAASLVLAIAMGVAFFKVHQMSLTGAGSGELAFLYLGACVTLVLSGAGKFSLDRE